MMRTRLTLPLLVLLALLGLPAQALVIEDGSSNHSRPADDPGWDNVGDIEGSLNAVYLGYGWAVTAGHVGLGAQAAFFDGASYPIVPGSEVVIEHNPYRDADLKVFRMLPYPRQLPVLPIASSVSEGDEVILIGRGSANGGALGSPPTGYRWGSSGVKRWGTNHLGATVDGQPRLSSVVSHAGQRTHSLFTQFDAGASAFESSVAAGDSGGALFVRKGAGWELAGVPWAILVGAAPEISSYGDDSASADLTYPYYRTQVLEITRPCSDGNDNDGDLLIDEDDPDCLGSGDLSEEPACMDGLDNDSDGEVDAADADCDSSGDQLEALDTDHDLVADWQDNCILIRNPDQLDTNVNGYGNACDADYRGEGTVTINDFILLVKAYGTTPGHPEFDEDIDMDGDGVIGATEYVFLSRVFGLPPGPSGLSCAGTPPCF